MKNFAFLGVAGYIAPRHFEAINHTGNRTVIAHDPNDSVGILDRYTQDVEYYQDFERFQSRWAELDGGDRHISWLSVCSPNYLHSAHMRLGLSQGCNVICEKPLVIDEKELDSLLNYEQKFGKKINTVLQLRVHDSIVALKQKINAANSKEKYDVELTYLTSRGPWYHESWKGQGKKSGGLATNIGVHFFDMLMWVFGPVLTSNLHIMNDHIVSGTMELEKARVNWALSIDRKYLPAEAIRNGQSTFRSIKVNTEEIEFSTGFTDLHNRVYEQALAGHGYGVEDARPAIKMVSQLRGANAIGINASSHWLLRSL